MPPLLIPCIGFSTGLTFTEKWTTENVLNTEVKIEDQLAEGLDLTFDTSFAPQTGKKSGKVKSAYKMDYLNLNCDVDFDFAGPTVHGAAVLGYEGWLAGYQMSFDSSKSKLTRSNFGFGYNGGDFSFTTNVNNTWDDDNDGQEFQGSIHQKVNDSLEAAVSLAWTAGTGSTTFALGAKYKLDDDASISVSSAYSVCVKGSSTLLVCLQMRCFWTDVVLGISNAPPVWFVCAR
ncbi:voltage-dependent anion-selective channel protein 2-like, partial [Aplysia californica]|uniref:Voltage-dependent anion-selective channel protein 2-like n=1 Tax=Aplysia californica TaxID=6500 RepID=A0ABM1AF75_APLCA